MYCVWVHACVSARLNECMWSSTCAHKHTLDSAITIHAKSSRAGPNQAKHHTKAKWSAEFATAATLAPAASSFKKKAADHQHWNATRKPRIKCKSVWPALWHKQVGWSSVNLVQISFRDLQLFFRFFLFIFLFSLLSPNIFNVWLFLKCVLLSEHSEHGAHTSLCRQPISFGNCKWSNKT